MQATHRRISTIFPLVVYSEENLARAPTEPTLWTFPFGFDLECIAIQTALDFARIDYTPMVVSSDHGAVNGQLPNLHLVDGSLLNREEIMSWIEKRTGAKSTARGRAWVALLRKSLVPCIIAALWSDPLFSSYTRQKYFSQARRGPFLSRYMYNWKASQRKNEQIQQLLNNPELSDGHTLHIEALEELAKQTLEAANNLLESQSDRSASIDGQPQFADALLYACITTINQLPEVNGETHWLKRILERPSNVALHNWQKQLRHQYPSSDKGS